MMAHQTFRDAHSPRIPPASKPNTGDFNRISKAAPPHLSAHYCSKGFGKRPPARSPLADGIGPCLAAAGGQPDFEATNFNPTSESPAKMRGSPIYFPSYKPDGRDGLNGTLAFQRATQCRQTPHQYGGFLFRAISVPSAASDRYTIASTTEGSPKISQSFATVSSGMAMPFCIATP